MSEKKLQEQILEEYGKRNLEKLEIPSYISENLSRELRDYQKEALKYYLAQRELQNDKDSDIQGNHLMFNMATGSGKTLVMAALMLECFKNGYRNFVFFVNSNAILEKTKENFCNATSSKYLFKERVIIDDKNVQIRAINNLNESVEGCINIYFGTIQGLYSVLTKERENALSFLDFENDKIVFLADEAHHLNADTKKFSKEESAIKQGWESIISKAFGAHSENMLLEFSATIPKDKAVVDKYKDKIVYEYALEKFCNDGYSKRIFLLKYENKSLESRFLGAVLLSLYKELLAFNEKMNLKPVILFKSESILSSKRNEEAFLEFLENVESKDIEDFYKQTYDEKNVFLSQSFAFFQAMGEDYTSKVCLLIKEKFKKPYILNANDEQEAQKYQILLNSLEDIKNDVRVIFAVNKLNEGWDVLNLFDIVRLNDKASATRKTTTSEVQLIGRGARYYPFYELHSKDKYPLEKEFKRKFDNDMENPLAHLERLNYHTLNEVKFIDELNKQMRQEGLLEDTKQRVELNLSEKAKELKQKYTFYYAKNERKKIGERDLWNTITIKNLNDELVLRIPHFTNRIAESEVHFKEESADKKESHKDIKVSEIPNASTLFLKALNQKNIDFEKLRSFRVHNEQVKSKKEFWDCILSPLRIQIHRKQDLNRENALRILGYILDEIKEFLSRKKSIPNVSEFVARKLDLNARVVFVSNSKEAQNAPEWLYFDKAFYDSRVESESFLNFIERNKEKLNAKFSEWIVVRNEGFSEFKIYDDRKDKETYGVGFEPDFILFCKQRDEEEFFALQCFMEVKREDYVKTIDKWKEEFLESLNGKTFKQILNEKGFMISQHNLTLKGFKFFTDKNNGGDFVRDFEIFLEGKK